MNNLKKEIQKLSILANMNSAPQLIEKVKSIIETEGEAAVKQVNSIILSSRYNKGIIPSALKYFSKVTLSRGLPVFPALISLSCKAVGGIEEKTTSIGAALMLIAGAADIHDDIIDQSSVKYSMKTVYGKFGRNIALLAGDTLLFLGLSRLNQECESLSAKQRKEIMTLVSEALFEISEAEAKESYFMNNSDGTPQEYYEIIKMKAVVSEIHCKIGAIIGNANAESVEALGSYGRTFGLASLVRDEFIDIYEHSELQNRIRNECPPLPLLYALQNSEAKKEVLFYIDKPNLTKRELNRIRKLVLGTEQVNLLKKDVDLLVEDGLKYLSGVEDNSYVRQLALLLSISTSNL